MKQSFQNGDVCPADGRYWCEGHYRTTSIEMKAGEIFRNCKASYGHSEGTIWINWDPEREETDKRFKNSLPN